MKSHELQLMVHGKNIALTTPRLRYDSVKIMRFATLESPNYLFINLDIQPGAQPGTFSIGFYQDEKQVAAYDYELKVREPGSAIRQGFDRSDVIYLLMPDRFANGNPANDSIPGMREQTHRSNPNGRHGGDIQGIADHLGYIRDLGATAIWVNPLLENNMPAFSYHGYAITDFYKIDPHFGTLDEY